MRCQCDSDAIDCSNDAVPGSRLCTTCVRLCCPEKPSTRYARIDGAMTPIEFVRRYLPSNYRAVEAHRPDVSIVIVGSDDHGWTLDGYVIPRLASGLIPAYEVK